MDTLTRAALGDVELAEPGERHIAATLQRLLDGVEDGVNRLAGLGLAQVGAAGNLIDELRLRHASIPPNEVVVIRRYQRSRTTFARNPHSYAVFPGVSPGNPLLAGFGRPPGSGAVCRKRRMYRGPTGRRQAV